MKADVETQGDFVTSLATEVRTSSFSDIEDLVAFVNWLDEELSFLVCMPLGVISYHHIMFSVDYMRRHETFS